MRGMDLIGYVLTVVVLVVVLEVARRLSRLDD